MTTGGSTYPLVYPLNSDKTKVGKTNPEKEGKTNPEKEGKTNPEKEKNTQKD